MVRFGAGSAITCRSCYCSDFITDSLDILATSGHYGISSEPIIVRSDICMLYTLDLVLEDAFKKQTRNTKYLREG